MDDEDEFVDAVEERDNEEQSGVENVEEGDRVGDDGFGDDGFGDFGDFEEHQVGDQVDEFLEEYNPYTEEFTQRVEGVRVQPSSSIPPSVNVHTPEIVHVTRSCLLIEGIRRLQGQNTRRNLPRSLRLSQQIPSP
jgi:hypothetical protein